MIPQALTLSGFSHSRLGYFIEIGGKGGGPLKTKNRIE